MLETHAIYQIRSNVVSRVSSWKQLPENETPLLVLPKDSPDPTSDLFDPQTSLPESYIRGSASRATAKGRHGRKAGNIDASFAKLPTDDITRAALTQIAHSSVPGHAMMISSPPGAGAVLAARTLAGEMTGLEALHYASPEGDRWTVAEVDEQIRRPAMFKAPEGMRTIVVVSDVDTMAPQAADRLLKTLEEPPSNTLFILTASSPTTLRPTLLGRLAGHIPIAPVAREGRIDSYMDMGLDKTEANILDTAIGSNFMLGQAVIEASAVTEAVAVLDPVARNLSAPISSAKKAASNIEKLATVVGSHMKDASDGFSDTNVSKVSDKQKKATVRVLTRHLVDRTVADLHKKYLTEYVASGKEVPVEELRVAFTVAATQAHNAIRSYVPTERVLAVFYSRLTALGL